jgi:hypothetical protein
MITHTDLKMQDGSVMHAEIVNMNGKTYVMMSVDDLPDYLHQQGPKSDAALASSLFAPRLYTSEQPTLRGVQTSPERFHARCRAPRSEE